MNSLDQSPSGGSRVTRFSGRDSGNVPLRTFTAVAATPSRGNSLIGVPALLRIPPRLSKRNQWRSGSGNCFNTLGVIPYDYVRFVWLFFRLR